MDDQDPNTDDDSSSSDNGSPAGSDSDSTGDSDSPTKPSCYGDVTLLNDPAGDGPSSVARGHDQASDPNTLNHDPLVGAIFVDITSVDPSDAKRSDGADWASGGVEPGSDADTAIDGAGPDASSAASLGAAIAQPATDALSAAGAAVSAAVGAIF